MDKDIEDVFEMLCDIVDAWEFEKLVVEKKQTDRKIHKAARYLYSRQKVIVVKVTDTEGKL